MSNGLSTLVRRTSAAVTVLAWFAAAVPAVEPSPGEVRTGIFGLEAEGNRFVSVSYTHLTLPTIYSV